MEAEMDQLWAPWRMDYIQAEPAAGCIFCIPDEVRTDRSRLILFANRFSTVMLNRYPYSNAHLLIAPRQHTQRLDSLETAGQLDLIRLLTICQQILEKTVCPSGFNIGMNLGKTAGAGVTDHLHLHIVPRWEGDVNFMTIIPETRVIPEHLMVTFDRLLPYFDQVSCGE
jgi:ATP adenylyltransferase